ncbi:MAG: LamG-like jellyroll fold domain-containing protein [Candidatus Acidiferrales bacterium]
MVAIRVSSGATGAAPAITSAGSTIFAASTAASFTVTATGTPMPTLSETGSLPSGVSFRDNGDGTAMLAGTATAGGIFPITITASNGVGSSATQSFTLTVNQPPALTSANGTTFTAGTPGSFTVTTIGTPTPSLTESGPLPSGVAFTNKGNGTAALSGTPASNAAGTYPVTITASDGVDSPATQNFTLTVNPANQSGPIAFVQVNYATPQGSNNITVKVTYTEPQAAADLNIVVVGWNDSTAKVSSVVDSAGNSYVLAVGPTVQNDAATQAIYYAQNITAAAANSNTVTVTFNTGAVSPDVRIAEYSGITTTNALDVVATAQGTSGTSNSDSATTTNSNDLLVGANLVQQSTAGAGAGYTSRVITSPDSDILEDSLVTMTGSYSATAPVSSGAWIMQMVAFRGAGSGVTGTSPAITSASSTTFTTGSAGSFTATATGTPTPTLTESGSLPSGVTFHDNGGSTATLGGTPSASGTFPITITANNGVGSPASQSFILTVSGSDTQAPTTPTNFTATAISGSQINLSWTASTDNVAVTGYLVERCAGVGCSNFARTLTVPGTTYSDTGLVPTTSYTYHVKATDAAGNFSLYSNTAGATTLQTIAGLVAAYSFDEGTGNTVTDLSDNGNNGTLSNATWTNAGKVGNALVLDGTDSLVTINDSASLHLTNGMTLEAWVNPSIVNSAWSDVVYKGNDNYFLEATSATGTPAGGGTFSSNNTVDYGPTTLQLNTWSHLAYTYDGSTLRLYVNGVQVSSLARAGNILTSTNPLQIGGDNIFGQYFAGMIDEVRVYNLPLNQTQIQADMTTAVSSLASLPAVTINGSSEINFGDETTGATSTPKTVTLTNSGSAQLSIASIAVSSGNTGDFAQTNNCGSALAAGNSCTISLTFTPQATGSRVSSVQITDNAPGSPRVINLSGSGTGFSVSPQSAVLTFTAAQQFTATSGSVTWSVDGAVGGSSPVGTITSGGLYTPPATVGTHTVTAATSTGSASATVHVTNYPGTFTFHNDNSRTGQNSNETVLNLSNVSEATFGKLFSYSLDGLAYASPLYVANVNIPGQGSHNVVYIATENDTVYAWDADGLSSNPLWKANFLRSGVTTVPCGDTGECGDIPDQIGVTGTSVIDPSTETLYVVAKTKEGSSYVQRLHALDIATGAEKFGGPVVIQATVSGSGDGSHGGQLTFDPLKENQRAALLLTSGVVYVAWAAHGDQAPWHGWVMGYTASTLQQTMAYCVSPNGYGGGIWMSNGGLATDSTGNVFFTTGNGDFSANSGGSDYGDSIVKISPNGSVVDYFTPYDQSYMEADDIDLASAGPVLLLDQPGPIPHVLIAAGKSGSIYVVNRDNMGQFNPNNNNQIVQTLQSVLPNGNQEEGNYSAPVLFSGYLYFGAVDDHLKAFQMSSGQLSPAPSSQSSEIYPNRGASFALSANGTSNGILWAVQDNSPSNGVLSAYDASALSHELYTSKQAGSRDTLGVATKFSIPLVANGKVFVVANGQIIAYGLLPF